MRVALCVALLAGLLTTTAHADELGDLKAQLEAATKSIKTLQDRVQTLEAKQKQKASSQVSALPVSQPAKAPTPVEKWGAPVVAPDTKPPIVLPGPNDARIEVRGAVQLDAIYDAKRMDPNWVATLRPSKIPVNCPPVGTDPGCGKNGITNFSVKSSSLDFRGFVPTATAWGEIKTQLAFDLWGDASEGKTNIRLVQAWASWGQLLVGVTDTLFMDIDVFPNILDFWGPSGMMFLRDPQIRWTPYDHEGRKVAIAFEVPQAAIDTGKLADIIPELNVREKPRYPDITAQLRADGTWGHVQLAGVARWITFDASNTINGRPNGTVFGGGVNLSGALKTFGDDALRGQIAVGRGIAAYSNDCCFDLAPSGTLAGAKALPLLNWLVYYDHWWNTQLSSSIGYSQNLQDNTIGQNNIEQHRGSYASANLIYYPMRNVKFGAEVLWGERVNIDGAKASDQRVQFTAQYKF